MNDERRRTARELATAALARRDHSRRELERKLRARGVERDAAEGALDALASAGLQSDGRFADGYVRQRMERGYGPRRIVAELRERGISEGAARQAVHDAGVVWGEVAAAVRDKKFPDRPRDAAARARQTRFLEYRGFDADHIRQALKQAAHDEDL